MDSRFRENDVLGNQKPIMPNLIGHPYHKLSKRTYLASMVAD